MLNPTGGIAVNTPNKYSKLGGVGAPPNFSKYTSGGGLGGGLASGGSLGGLGAQLVGGSGGGLANNPYSLNYN